MEKEEDEPDSGSLKEYSIELDDAAEREFAKLPKKAKVQITKLINSLADDPRAGNVRELTGYRGIYRKRTGDYRVIYTIEEAILTVLIIAIGPRKIIYDLLKRRVR